MLKLKEEDPVEKVAVPALLATVQKLRYTRKELVGRHVIDGALMTRWNHAIMSTLLLLKVGGGGGEGSEHCQKHVTHLWRCP